jgi:hypothetical protein
MFDLPFLHFIASLIINHNTINSFSWSTNQKYFEFLAAFPVRCTEAEGCKAFCLATGYKITCSLGGIIMLPRELRRKGIRALFLLFRLFYDLLIKIHDKLINHT